MLCLLHQRKSTPHIITIMFLTYIFQDGNNLYQHQPHIISIVAEYLFREWHTLTHIRIQNRHNTNKPLPISSWCVTTEEKYSLNNVFIYKYFCRICVQYLYHLPPPSTLPPLSTLVHTVCILLNKNMVFIRCIHISIFFFGLRPWWTQYNNFREKKKESGKGMRCVHIMG